MEVYSEVQIKHAVELCKPIINSSIFSKNAEYITDYKGEWHYRDEGMKGYGAAWLAVKKFFDASCRIQLHKRYSEPISEEANYSKLVHCFLNQQGFNLKHEMGVIMNILLGRLATNLSFDGRHTMLKDFVEKTRDFPGLLEELFSLIQEDKFDEAKKKMATQKKNT